MKRMVVAVMLSDTPNSIQVMFSVPFRLSLTDLISNLDISGTVSLSDVLKTVTLEDFIIALGTYTMIDERDMSIG